MNTVGGRILQGGAYGTLIGLAASSVYNLIHDVELSRQLRERYNKEKSDEADPNTIVVTVPEKSASARTAVEDAFSSESMCEPGTAECRSCSSVNGVMMRRDSEGKFVEKLAGRNYNPTVMPLLANSDSTAISQGVSDAGYALSAIAMTAIASKIMDKIYDNRNKKKLDDMLRAARQRNYDLVEQSKSAEAYVSQKRAALKVVDSNGNPRALPSGSGGAGSAAPSFSPLGGLLTLLALGTFGVGAISKNHFDKVEPPEVDESFDLDEEPVIRRVVVKTRKRKDMDNVTAGDEDLVLTPDAALAAVIGLRSFVKHAQVSIDDAGSLYDTIKGLGIEGISDNDKNIFDVINGIRENYGSIGPEGAGGLDADSLVDQIADGVHDAARGSSGFFGRLAGIPGQMRDRVNALDPAARMRLLASVGKDYTNWLGQDAQAEHRRDMIGNYLDSRIGENSWLKGSFLWDSILRPLAMAILGGKWGQGKVVDRARGAIGGALDTSRDAYIGRLGRRAMGMLENTPDDIFGESEAGRSYNDAVSRMRQAGIPDYEIIQFMQNLKPGALSNGMDPVDLEIAARTRTPEEQAASGAAARSEYENSDRDAYGDSMRERLDESASRTGYLQDEARRRAEEAAEQDRRRNAVKGRADAQRYANEQEAKRIAAEQEAKHIAAEQERAIADSEPAMSVVRGMPSGNHALPGIGQRNGVEMPNPENVFAGGGRTVSPDDTAGIELEALRRAALSNVPRLNVPTAATPDPTAIATPGQRRRSNPIVHDFTRPSGLSKGYVDNLITTGPVDIGPVQEAEPEPPVKPGFKVKTGSFLDLVNFDVLSNMQNMMNDDEGGAGEQKKTDGKKKRKRDSEKYTTKVKVVSGDPAAEKYLEEHADEIRRLVQRINAKGTRSI